jgi:molybdate transport system ATP-binding protein
MLSVQLAKQRGDFRLELAFEAPASGLIALFGRSGCGKSTALNLIAGLLPADSGRIELGGHTLYDAARGIDVPAERRGIGYVFQDARLFPHLDVLANLRYGAKRAAASARGIDFDEVIELLGLQSLLPRRTHQLSGGERQRVAFGRALLRQPRLMLLDEPLAALDAARREELLPYLERLRDRLAVPIVYVSHQFEEVLRLATHVVLLETGSVRAQGDIASVSRRSELRAIVGPELVGAVVEGRVDAVDPATGLAELTVAAGRMHVEADGLSPGQIIRIQLLARDLILATEPPRGLSVRNRLAGTIVALAADDTRAQLLEVDIGGATVLVRVTNAACAELRLQVGCPVWVLVKAASLRGHVYPGRHPGETPAAREHPTAGRAAGPGAGGSAS